MASKPGILRLAFSKFNGRRDLVRDDKGVAKIDGLLLSFCKVFQAIPLRLNREYPSNEYFLTDFLFTILVCVFWRFSFSRLSNFIQYFFLGFKSCAKSVTFKLPVVAFSPLPLLVSCPG